HAHRLRIQVSRAAIAGARSPRGLGERHPGRGAPGHRRLSGAPSSFWLDSVRRCGLVSEARFPPGRRVGTREDDRQDKELGMSELTRRGFLRTGSAALAGAVAAGGLSGCASTKGETQPTGKRRVVVIGGGWGGATAAKYVRIGDPSIEVVLLEPNRQFISCPFSNLVLAGLRNIESLSFGYEGLRKRGVQVRHEMALAVEPDTKRVRLASGYLSYERLIVSPGVDFQLELVEGLPAAKETVLHAWKAGPQTVQLARQIQAMPDGGVFVLTVPPVAYRCPPG